MFSEDYVKFGFTFMEKDELQLPQCVICMKVLSNDRMRTNRLERYLKQQHPTLALKTKRCIAASQSSLEIAFMIAKQYKPHTIGEELIKPCVLKATQIILGDGAEQKVESISLSNNTVKRRIDDIAADIKSQIINKVKLSTFFAISCDESTDVVNCAQLMVYVRYIGGDIIQEEIFFLKKKRFGLKEILWNLHKWRTLSQKLRQTLDSAIRIVNYIKSSALNCRLFTLLCEDLESDHKVLLFHTKVRWLSQCNMLDRLYELKEEAGFSALVLIKTKQRNRLDVDSDLIIALAKTDPTINQLVQDMQSQNSGSQILMRRENDAPIMECDNEQAQ
ncbi:unnamed protein product [Acanthoscelides obtectus]|uniref:Uncharacterized protein n=1 Tax=Acanthoscelides obtectus TaxID=200917 RepID=A0A9P0L6L8_ACAOB|nr:unnamed protein product [Acanthoscelides obtectus]CAK1649259.1 Protein ZBED8 [Acanthoscelides obtectus]